MGVEQDDDAGAPMLFRPLFVELSHILLLVTVVACHPGSGEAQHPELPAQQIGEAQLPDPPASQVGEVHHPAPPSQKVDVKRPIYARFFNVLKRQVALAWDPAPVWRRADPTGTRYGKKTRTIELRVSLSPQGELVKILVVSPSGSNELDEEAVRAFQAAAPFPNPPEGLVEKDNLFTFGFSFFFNPGSPRPLSSPPQPQTPQAGGPQ